MFLTINFLNQLESDNKVEKSYCSKNDFIKFEGFYLDDLQFLEYFKLYQHHC